MFVARMRKTNTNTRAYESVEGKEAAGAFQAAR